MSISVIVSTNRKEKLEEILNNFNRQNFYKKELIIILNLDYISSPSQNNILEINSNVKAYTLGSKVTLGQCLNYGISKAKYEYIAKMDDDDYYGENYLHRSLSSLLKSKVDIIGKSCIYVYFENEDFLGLRHPTRENQYVDRVEGATLFFKKDIFPRVSFSDKNLGEDISFCKMAINNGFRIYSAGRDDYVYLRGDYQKHTWKIHNSFLIRECIKCGNKNDLQDLIVSWRNNLE